MRIWNVSEVDINHLYNSKLVVIKANTAKEVDDALGLFLLNNKEIRGLGLVELREGDNKAEVYKQGRKQIYDWAVSKYGDFEKHCEEREAQRLQPLRPHKEILEYKNIIDTYEKWLEAGEPVKEEYKEIVGEKRIFVCPQCSQEFSTKELYFQHIPSHKEEVDGNTGVANNTGQGKG